MFKNSKKIICAAVCVALAGGMAVTAACNGVRNSIKLKEDEGTNVESNGGFVVQTDDYVYFVNGVASNTDDNSYGDVVKGAIMRISKEDLKNHNYMTGVETVVPQIYYNSNYSTGLYIYDGYIYYCTPSTDRNSDGDILNSYLDFKRTKLNGSESMRGSYYQSTTTSVDYRFVKGDDGVVYLMYATSEDYYGTGTSYTNIHTINTETNVNTVIAYNVSSYTFDTGDSESDVVYYTMAVTENLGNDDSITQSSNQVYRATATVTEADNKNALGNEYDFSYVDTEDEDYNEDDPLYVNCGTLVYDGIGSVSALYPTQFNAYGEDGDYSKITHSDYTYSLSDFHDGILYYTRSAASSDMMFILDDGEFASSTSSTPWDAITKNPTNYEDAFLVDSSSASNYTFITGEDADGNMVYKALYTENNRFMLGEINFKSTTYSEDGVEYITGKVVDEYCLTDGAEDSAPGYLFIDGDYLYYSISGDSDNAIYRIKWNGTYDDYNKLSTDTESDDYKDYKEVRILDLEYNSSWFAPEIADNQLIYASETREDGNFGMIMVCDLRNDDGEMMSNAELSKYDDLLQSVYDAIDDVDEDTYEYLPDALYYLFYTRDVDYIDTLINTWVEYQDKKETYLFSKQSVAAYKDFLTAGDSEIDWSDFNDTKTVNGETVYASSMDYYYSILGAMTDDDYDDYIEDLQADYMPSEADDERTWWDKINTAAKVCFIIGMCLCGLIVLAGLGVGIYFLVKFILKKTKKPNEEPKKKDSAVDITDDKTIDVYNREQATEAGDEKEAAETTTEAEEEATTDTATEDKPQSLSDEGKTE